MVVAFGMVRGREYLDGVQPEHKKPYGFCLTNPQAIEDFHGSLFKADIDTGINTV